MFIILVFLPILSMGSLIYLKANKIYHQEVMESTEEIINKIEQNISSVIQDTEDLTNYMIYDRDFQEFFKLTDTTENRVRLSALKDRITGYIVFHLNSKPYINSVTVKGLNSTDLYIGEPINIIENKIDNEIQKAAGGLVWSHSYPVKTATKGYMDIVTVGRVINDINQFSIPIGQIKIHLNVNELEKMISADSIQGLRDVLIVNKNGDILLHHRKGADVMKLQEKWLINQINEHPSQSTFIHPQYKNHIVLKKGLLEGNWYMVATIDKQQIVNEFDSVLSFIAYMLLICTFLGAIAFTGFYYFNIRPILDLTEETQRVEKGDFSAQVKVLFNDEIGQLGIRFNKMVREIQRLINKEYRLKIQQRESELKALQNQINPHFLYNTLDMIRWTARLEKAYETSELIEMLSNIFRSTLKNGEIWVYLEEELKFIESYLHLQKKRLGQRLNYSIQADQEIKQVIILKQILQPLIENSIQHGINTYNQDCQIDIHCHMEKDQLMIDIKDNGIGIKVEDFKEIFEKQRGFALRNIQNRLYTGFGAGYGLELMNSDVGGTWIRITVPIQYNTFRMNEKGIE
jgi:two-component system, sensor histidine kinase YesM